LEANRLGTTPDADLLARFLADRNPAAFAALVRRHGPLVLAACRRVLGDGPDAEDAFQAAFLVLLRDAHAIRGRAVGPWLYGVARRVSLQLRADARRRRRREERAAGWAPAGPAPPDLSWREACAVLHEELDLLPEKYRLPLILCYLEGKSREEVAQLLGWSPGALKGRLERGRERLRRRLERRGLAPAVGLLAALVPPAEAAPPALVNATVRLAFRGPATPAAASQAVLLARAAARPVGVVRRVAAAVLLAAGLAGGGLVVRAAVGQADKQAAAPAREMAPLAAGVKGAKPAPPADGATLTVRGRVIGPDGNPAAGARLFVCDEAGKAPAPQPAADADGRFRFTLGPAPAGEGYRYVLAAADGRGCDWAKVTAALPDGGLTLRLPPEMPVTGRVVDLQGRPVAGARVRLAGLATTASGGLAEFLQVWREDKKDRGRAFRVLEKRLYGDAALGRVAAATADADGRFTLRGLGRDHVATLRVGGAGVAEQFAEVVTRPDFRPGPPKPDQFPLYGPSPALVAAPGKPVAGTVRDAKTKRPLAGVRVAGRVHAGWYELEVETTTDAAGRFRLEGLPKVSKQQLSFSAAPGRPYVHRYLEVADTDGLEPLRADVDLAPGVVVSGRLTDKVTGRPVRGRVIYTALVTNDFVPRTPGYVQPEPAPRAGDDSAFTDAEGRYRLTALPGPGVLKAQAVFGESNPCPYMTARVAPEDSDPTIYGKDFDDFHLYNGGGYPLSYVNAYRIVRPPAGAEGLTADFALDPGRSRSGRVVDPEGRPLAGVVPYNLFPLYGAPKPLPGAEFTAAGLDPGRPRRLVFFYPTERHPGRKLGATVVLRGDEREPVVVKLRPLAAVTGRVLDADSRPVAGARMHPSFPEYDLTILNNLTHFHDRPTETDAEGRFRLDALPADVEFRVISPHGYTPKMTLKPGEVRDLGDLWPD
jgi:RNA polymerase sigma factor (sigma-70 family)